MWFFKQDTSSCDDGIVSIYFKIQSCTRKLWAGQEHAQSVHCDQDLWAVWILHAYCRHVMLIICAKCFENHITHDKVMDGQVCAVTLTFELSVYLNVIHHHVIIIMCASLFYYQMMQGKVRCRTRKWLTCLPLLWRVCYQYDSCTWHDEFLWSFVPNCLKIPVYATKFRSEHKHAQSMCKGFPG